MRDLQNEHTGFVQKAVQSVGVSGIRGIITIVPPMDSFYCHRIMGGGTAPLRLLAAFDAVCPLPATQRGINMSRTGRAIYDFLQEHSEDGVATLSMLARSLMTAHKAAGATVKATFDYPIQVFSPVTHTPGIKCMDVAMQSDLNGEECHDYLTVTTRENSLCPCSKLMTMDESGLGRGAHNQIVDITARVELAPQTARHCDGQSSEAPSSLLPRTIEDIYSILSSCASAETYPVLRRQDEKAVTEQAWNTPRFVEDIVRMVATRLDSYAPILHYSVTVNSHESIHSDGIIATAAISDE